MSEPDRDREPRIPNLNSPPGMPIPNVPPSRANISSLSSTNTTSEQPASMLETSFASQSVQHPQYPSFIYNSCLAATLAIPFVAMIPPRRMDLSMFTLGVSWCLSTGIVLEHRTGRGLMWHVASRLPSQGNYERRDREARALDRAQREEKIRRAVSEGRMAQEEGKLRLAQVVRDIEDEKRKEKEAKEKRARERGPIGRFWIGSEGEDWVEKRRRKEEKAFEEGKGYGGLMWDQIVEAFGFKLEDDDDDDEDEK